MGTPHLIRNGLRVYGSWAGNPAGTLEDTAYCAEEVWPSDGRWTPHQCNRKRRHGPNGEFCKQHARRHEAHKPE